MRISSIENERKIEYNTKLFSTAVVIMLLRLLLGYSAITGAIIPNIVFSILNMLFVLILTFKIVVIQKYTPRQLLIIGILSVCILISFSYSRFATIIYTVLEIIAIQNVDIKKVVKLTCKIKTIYIAFQTIVYFVLLSINSSIITFDYRAGDRTSGARHNFLMGHANIASMLVSWTILEYIFVNYQKVTKKQLLLLWCINLIYKVFTDSNSSLIVVSVVVILSLLEKSCGNKMKKVIGIISKYVFVFCGIFSITMCVIYTYLSGVLLEAWNNISAFFTGRLLYGACVYDLSGISWIGKNISYFNNKIYWRGNWIDGLVFDNTYILFFVLYGCIILILFALLQIKANKYFDTEEKIIIIAFSIYAMMEQYVLYSVFCFAIILLGKAIYGNLTIINNVRDKGIVN